MKRGQILWRARDGEPDVWGIDAAPHVLMKVKRVFPRANQERSGLVILADTPEVARDLEWLRGRYQFDADDETIARLTRRADEHRATERAVAAILSGERRSDGRYREVDPGREHRDYQYAAADLVLATGHLLLADELGLGKSMSGLLILREPEALPALVVCLTHLPAQWASEIRATFPGLRVHVARTLEAYDPAARRGAGGVDPDVMIVPWSKLRGWGDHLAGQVRTVIFDEAQELRKDGTLKYLAAARVADGADYVMGLTATPVYNYAGEIHTVYQVIAPNALGTRSEFIREWQGSIVSGLGQDNVAVDDPGALGEYLRAEGLFLRRTRKDVGRELPDVIRVTHAIDSDAESYRRLEEEALDLAELIVGVVPDRPENVASLDAARNRRAWQARGELDWKLRQATGIAKAPYVAAFTEMLLESDEQVVLYGWHRAVYDIWIPRLVRWRPALYTGTESPAAKQRSRDAFVDGEARVLVMSLRAGAGLDGLQEASHVAVFGELDWSPGMHEQCLDAATEVLTARGYLGPDDLRDDDQVACWDENDGTVRWSPVLGRVDRPLGSDEEMVEIRLPAVDLRLTAGHRVVWRPPSHGRHFPRPGRWRTTEASALLNRRAGWHLPVAGVQDAPGVPLTDAEIAFVGWVLTDGHLNRRTRQVTISQDERSPENASIVAALDGAGLAWTSRVMERRTAWSERSRMIVYCVPKIRSRTRPGTGWAKLERWLDKDVTPAWEDATADQVAVLLRAMNDGDGAKMRDRDYTPGTWVIGTSRRRAAERLTSLAQRRGWRVSLAEIRTEAGRPHWHLHLRPGAYRHIGGSDGRPRIQISPSTPRERVWCVTTETGTLLVRRNGKTAIVGNCVGRLQRDGQGQQVLAYFLVSEQGTDPLMAEVLNLKRQQSEPILDPDAPLHAPLPDHGDRIRLLAEAVMRRRGRL